MGTIYPAPVPGSPVDGIAAVDAIPGQILYPGAGASGTEYYTQQGSKVIDANGDGDFTDPGDTPIPAGEDLEDGWGIFRLTDITNTNDSSDILWLDGDGGKEVVGLFYGLSDNGVRDSVTPGETLIQSEGMKVDFYEQADGRFDSFGNENQGSAGRTALATYTGITDAGPGPILSCVSTAADLLNFAGLSGPPEFKAFFTPSGVTGDGTFISRLNVVGGSNAAMFDTNGMVGGLADLTLNGTTTANTTPVANWTVLDEDPFRGNVIPEPLTMAGLMLGVGSLVGYVRRRR
jgi:hypothetical protein